MGRHSHADKPHAERLEEAWQVQISYREKLQSSSGARNPAACTGQRVAVSNRRAVS